MKSKLAIISFIISIASLIAIGLYITQTFISSKYVNFSFVQVKLMPLVSIFLSIISFILSILGLKKISIFNLEGKFIAWFSFIISIIITLTVTTFLVFMTKLHGTFPPFPIE